MPSESLVDWVALHLLPGLGPKLARRALARLGSPGEIAFRASGAVLKEVRGIADGVAASALSARSGLRARAEKEIAACVRLGIRILPLNDPGFPAAFEALDDAPVVVYMKGELRPGVVRVALVGSRRATSYGKRVAVGLAAGLARRGIEIVSGGARGIDTCAHEGALEIGGRTVAVLGSGMLKPYPEENAPLFERIASSGVLLSEFPCDAPPLAEHFPRRNRLISALSAAVVVVEAASRSGSLSTAGHALDQGREVMAVPGPVSSEQSSGCHRLIQQGAKLVQSVEDVVEELSPLYRHAILSPAETPTAGPDRSGLTADESAVMGLLERETEPLHIDLLAERIHLGISRLQVALLGLTLRGAVEQSGGRYYVAGPRKDP